MPRFNRRHAVPLMVSVAALLVEMVPAQAAPLDLKLGALLESTGPLSELGPPAEKAIKLSAEAATKAAASAGVQATVGMVAADSQGDPQAALSAARTLVDRGAACIIGPATTPESIAVLNGLTMQKKVTLWPTATSTRLRTVKDDGTIFRTVPPDDLQARALVLAMDKYIGKGKSVSIAYRNEPYGDALSKSFVQAWTADGGKILADVSFDPQQATFDSEADQTVADKPDAVLVIDYPETFAKIGAALVRTGKFDAKKLFLTDAMSFAKVPDSIPAQAIDGAHGVAAGAPTNSAPYKAFNALWDKAGGVANTSLTSNMFDAGILCFLASLEAGSTDPGAIRDKIRTVTTDGAPQYSLDNLADAVKVAASGKPLDYVGASGKLSFAPNGDSTSSIYDVFQYQGGKQVTVDQVDVH